ncbi:MAG: RCC1 domain-containing protein [Caldilineaceae bacterium]
MENRLTPVPVAALPTAVATLGAGERHSCAGLVDGSAVCWGGNDAGSWATTRPSPSCSQSRYKA